MFPAQIHTTLRLRFTSKLIPPIRKKGLKAFVTETFTFGGGRRE